MRAEYFTKKCEKTKRWKIMVFFQEKMREMMGLVVTDHFKRMVDSVLNESLALIEQTNLNMDQISLDQLKPDQIEVKPVPANLDPSKDNPKEFNLDQTVVNPDQVKSPKDSGNQFMTSLSTENQIKDKSSKEVSEDPIEIQEDAREGQTVETTEVKFVESQTNGDFAKPIEITNGEKTVGGNEKIDGQIIPTKIQNGSTSKIEVLEKHQNGIIRNNDLHKIEVNNQVNKIESPKLDSQRNGSTTIYQKHVSPVSAAKSKFLGQKSSKNFTFTSLISSEMLNSAN